VKYNKNLKRYFL